MTNETIELYVTPYSRCSYLTGKMERKVFTYLNQHNAQALNDLLVHHGFRRSQSIIYKPFCEECNACLSTRIPVDSFASSKNMKRIEKGHKDLMGEVKSAQVTSEMYSLFSSYINARHHGAGMSEMSVREFTQMIEDSPVSTHIVEYRKRGIDSGITGKGQEELLGVVLVDVLEDGLSLVYSFYDPDLYHRSMGTYIILDQIKRTIKAGLPYLYLGYWVKGSPKMDYKKRFKPQECFINSRGWQILE